MIDLATVMGALGLISGVVAILYSHRQAVSLRLQAQEAARMSILQSNSELLERSRKIRRDILSTPAIRDEFLSTAVAQGPLSDLADLLRSSDGVERYLVYRDAMDAAQDAFFLRRGRVMSDEHWYVWTNVHMSIWAKYPGFEKNFRVAAKSKFIHPDFVEFYESIFKGGVPTDPARLPR